MKKAVLFCVTSAAVVPASRGIIRPTSARTRRDSAVPSDHAAAAAAAACRSAPHQAVVSSGVSSKAAFSLSAA